MLGNEGPKIGESLLLEFIRFYFYFVDVNPLRVVRLVCYIFVGIPIKLARGVRSYENFGGKYLCYSYCCILLIILA